MATLPLAKPCTHQTANASAFIFAAPSFVFMPFNLHKLTHHNGLGDATQFEKDIGIYNPGRPGEMPLIQAMPPTTDVDIVIHSLQKQIRRRLLLETSECSPRLMVKPYGIMMIICLVLGWLIAL